MPWKKEVKEMSAKRGPWPHCVGPSSSAAEGLCMWHLPREVLTSPLVRPRGDRTTLPQIQNGGYRRKALGLEIAELLARLTVCSW